MNKDAYTREELMQYRGMTTGQMQKLCPDVLDVIKTIISESEKHLIRMTTGKWKTQNDNKPWWSVTTAYWPTQGGINDWYQPKFFDVGDYVFFKNNGVAKVDREQEEDNATWVYLVHQPDKTGATCNVIVSLNVGMKFYAPWTENKQEAERVKIVAVREPVEGEKWIDGYSEGITTWDKGKDVPMYLRDKFEGFRYILEDVVPEEVLLDVIVDKDGDVVVTGTDHGYEPQATVGEGLTINGESYTIASFQYDEPSGIPQERSFPIAWFNVKTGNMNMSRPVLGRADIRVASKALCVKLPVS